MTEVTPKTNLTLFGHEDAEALLLADLARERLPHGLIISGPRGIGKATLAYRFARMLLADADSMEMSREHPVFRRVAAGSHSDLLVVEPEFDEKKAEAAREIKAEEAREVSRFLPLTAGEGKWRVVIVDAADALNQTAANAILKILEEPPPQTILLLISHTPGKLLPTIRSRCRILKLKVLSRAHFNRVMQHVAPDASAEELTSLAELSAYSPGLALEFREQGALETYQELLALMNALPQPDPQRLHGFADQVTAGQPHANWQLLGRLMLQLIGRTAKQASGIISEPICNEETETLAKLAALHSAAIWALKWQQCADQFLLAETRHLDYKQVIIAFIHSIASKEGFQIGNLAA